MSTRGLYTFIGEMFPAWVDRTTGKKHPAKRAHSWNVYKHSDNYPTGAAGMIEAALAHAWRLPRYEADEFAAAFIAANKSHYISRELEELRAIYTGLSQGKGTRDFAEHIKEVEHMRKYGADYNGGQVRLMPQGKPLAVAEKNCSDIEYRYEISCPDADVIGKPKTASLGAGLIVKCFEVSIAWRPEDKTKEELLFCGELPAFKRWAEAKEKRAQAAYEKAEAKRKAKG